MAKKNDTVETLLVPVKRGGDGLVDIDALLTSAEEVGRAYREQDAASTKAVVETIKGIVSDKRYEKLTVITASTLARLALVKMGEIPNDKLCAEAELRVKAAMLGNDDFLFIAAGRNAGFHFKDRYDAENLAKLQKQADKGGDVEPLSDR